MRPGQAPLFLIALPMLLLTGCEIPLGKDAGKKPRPAPELQHQAKNSSDSAGFGQDNTTSARANAITVNGQTITVKDILRPVIVDIREKEKALPKQEYYLFVRDRVSASVIRNVQDVLLYEAATRRLSSEDLQKYDALIDDRIREAVNSDRFRGVQHLYENHLVNELDTTLDDERERIRRDLVVAHYLQKQIGPKIEEPTRRELEKLHQDLAREKQSNQKRSMSLIDLPNTPEGEQTMNAVLSALSRGQDFHELAKQYSKGVHASKGGQWGVVDPESVVDRWKPAVEALPELGQGQVSHVIPAEDALFLVRCDEVHTERVPSFAEIQRELRDKYRDAQWKQMVAQIVRELQQGAVVRPDDLSGFARTAMETAVGVQMAGMRP